MSAFSETLTKFRRAAGYKTAYAFYHGGGGAPVLKMSYANYMATERGRSLPALARLPALLQALGLKQGSDGAAELTRAWLRSSCGETPYRWLLDPLMKGPSRPASPSEDAGEGGPVTVGPEQLAAIVSSQAACLSFLALSNDSGSITAAQLAARLELGETETAAALRALTGAGVLKERTPGRYKCPWTGASLVFPAGPAAAAARAKFEELQKGLVDSGQVRFASKGIVRVESSQLEEVYRLISLFLDSANIYARTSRSRRSSLMAVDGRVIKIEDFSLQPPAAARPTGR